jgi:RNA polymerase sigma factor (sigma-70 family)
LTDQELIKGCIKEDVHCQRALFERFAGKMMTVCLRYANDKMEAEDMLQDGFVRVFNYLKQYSGEGSFEGWVRRVMVNVALRHCQKRKQKFSEVNDASERIESGEPFAHDRLSENEILKMVQQLPQGYRIVFNLHVLEGYGHEEIGEMLNIGASTSRSQLVKARKMLQTMLLEQQKIVA